MKLAQRTASIVVGRRVLVQVAAPPVTVQLVSGAVAPGWLSLLRRGWLDRVDDGRVQAVTGGPGGGDADVGETGRCQQVVVLASGEGPGQAADLPFGCGAPHWVDGVVDGDVADAEPSAGPQDPERLGEYGGLVGGQV